MWAALKSSSNRTSITIGGSVDSSCFRSSAVWISAFITRYDELLMIAQLPAFAPSISGTHVDRTACCESKPVQGALYNMHRSRTRDRVDPGACLGQWRREGPACLSETAEPVDAPSPLLVLRKLPGSNLLRPYSGLTGSNSRAVRWSRRDTPYLGRSWISCLARSSRSSATMSQGPSGRRSLVCDGPYSTGRGMKAVCKPKDRAACRS